MMDGLRWLLLVTGILVIAGVYLYSRKDRTKSVEELDSSRRVEPTFDDDELEVEVVDEPRPVADDLQDAPQKIVTLRLVARDRGAFPGDDLVLSLRGIGMRHGKFGIFHRFDGNDETQTIFSAASLVEPGSFDLANIKDQQIPGISLFLVLPGPIDGVEGFDLMMATARTLAQSLGADLLDESGSTLSIQRERFMREEIIQFQHSILVA
jgi:cell division protein ZipA